MSEPQDMMLREISQSQIDKYHLLMSMKQSKSRVLAVKGWGRWKWGVLVKGYKVQWDESFLEICSVVLPACLSLFWLPSQITINLVAYKQQKFMAHNSGGQRFQIRVPGCRLLLVASHGIVTRDLWYLFSFFFFFFMVTPWHMEVPRPGMKFKLQLQFMPQLRQCWIF